MKTCSLLRTRLRLVGTVEQLMNLWSYKIEIIEIKKKIYWFKKKYYNNNEKIVRIYIYKKIKIKK